MSEAGLKSMYKLNMKIEELIDHGQALWRLVRRSLPQPLEAG